MLEYEYFIFIKQDSILEFDLTVENKFFLSELNLLIFLILLKNIIFLKLKIN